MFNSFWLMRMQYSIGWTVNDLFGRIKRNFILFFSKQNRMKLIWYAQQRLKKDRHKSWKHLLIHNRKRSSYSKSIKCLSSIRRSSALPTEVKWNSVFIKSNQKKVQLSDSRPKQLHEINSCEQLNEMEEYLRIDCFASANSFVLCFNFDKRKNKQCPKCSTAFYGSQTHSPLNSIRNSLVDKNYTCSHMRMHRRTQLRTFQPKKIQENTERFWLAF